MYSFSFEQNPDWSEMYAPQQEIRDYLERVTDKYGVRPHLRFGVRPSQRDVGRGRRPLALRRRRARRRARR